VIAQEADELTTLNQQIEQLSKAGQYLLAIETAKRALALTESRFGHDHLEVGKALDELAALYRADRHYEDAVPFMTRSLAIKEKALGPDHPDVAQALERLAIAYVHQNRIHEAELLSKRALAITEKALGPNDPLVVESLLNLAEMYRIEGREADAEPLYKRAIAITEERGPDDPDFANSLTLLADMYGYRRRYAEAEPLLKRALAIAEKAFGPDDPRVGDRLSGLAWLYGRQGRCADAETLYRRALAIAEKTFGPDDPRIGDRLSRLATAYSCQARYSEAEPLLKRALAITEKALGPEHLTTVDLVNGLGGLYFAQSDWARATDYWRRSADVTIRSAQRGLSGEVLTGQRTSEVEQAEPVFTRLIKAASRLQSVQRENTGLLHEMFQVAQWAHSSETAKSLAEMAARGVKADPRLAALTRERQDLVAEWHRRDADRSAAIVRAADQRDPSAEAANVARLASIESAIDSIDARLRVDVPNYAALVSTMPLSVEDVQAQLGSDEALLLFLDTEEAKPTPEETFIWIVTKSDARWVRSELGTSALRREVAALRCGLDYEGAWLAKNSRCSDLLKATYGPLDDALQKPLPFDLMRAHSLYMALFGQVEDLVKDKRLLIVQSGPLTQLPFQVLVAAPPKTAVPASVAEYRDAAWLKHAITVLPAVSSLKALRELAKESHASEPYIGFGNPLLEGNSGDERDAADAKLAREKSCSRTLRQRVAVLLGARGGARPTMRSAEGLIDVADIRHHAPLPETADELCDVARDLRVDPATHLYIGAKATESTVKHLSDTGVLARYRIVHFATHGFIAGEMSAASEPGLILTPPDKPSEIDDGYLSASEITALKLDADWVILSACNTAAGETKGAEALSGLARAFFYAGARSLLVSHWSVYSDATVKLISGAAEAIRSDPKIGRAEALRRSMVHLIAAGDKGEAHPAFWAPFVLVGEGGAGR